MPPGAADHHHQAAPPPSPRRGIMPQSPLRIKQDGKFYQRLLTKESSASAGNLSFRYYWAEPGSVPFVWETQPGTPRDVAGIAAGALPAITPPPAYVLRHGTGKVVVAAGSHHHHRQQSKKGKKRCRLKRIKIGFVAGMFRRLSLVRAWRRPASPAKVSSSRRWLFCSVAAERGKPDHYENENANAARQHETVMCCGSSFRARPRPWLPRFRSAGKRDSSNGDWA